MTPHTNCKMKTVTCSIEIVWPYKVKRYTPDTDLTVGSHANRVQVVDLKGVSGGHLQGCNSYKSKWQKSLWGASSWQRDFAKHPTSCLLACNPTQMGFSWPNFCFQNHTMSRRESSVVVVALCIPSLNPPAELCHMSPVFTLIITHCKQTIPHHVFFFSLVLKILRIPFKKKIPLLYIVIQ